MFHFGTGKGWETIGSLGKGEKKKALEACKRGFEDKGGLVNLKGRCHRRERKSRH